MTKAIVITGGSRGIGAATARAAGRRGWSVAINYAGSEGAAKETAAAVEAAGGRAIVVQGDVSEEAAVLRLFDAAADAFGRIDGVLNNAGIMIGGRRKIVDIDLARMERMVAVNVVGALLVAREGVRRMSKESGGSGGVIVNVSSAAARIGGANEFIDYAATKGAMDTMTLGLSKEAGPVGVRVNAVRPGLIETDMNSAERLSALVPGVPLGRSGSADEVAETIVWLMSDAASYVTGAIVDVTGGR